MSTSHKQIVKELFDIMNECRWDDAVQFYVDHFKEDFYFLGEAWIDRELNLIKSNGKAVAKEVRGPVKDKLQEGDEIIQI